MKKINYIIIVAIILSIFQVNLYCQNNKDEIYITILHTNDQHGHLEPFNIIGQKNVGGIAERFTLIKRVKKEVEQKKGNLLIFDSGDVNTGEPISDMLMAEPDIKCMNILGYQAMAVGNHEFDLTLEQLFKQQKWAKFPYLSANIFYKKNHKLLFKPYIIINIKGLKIGVFGITTPDTPLISTHGDNPNIIFEKPEKVIPQILKELKPKTDFIICLMHIEHLEVVRLANLFKNKGINIILGGHTHIATPQPVVVGNTLVVEAGAYGIMVGRFDLIFKNKKLIDWKYKLIGINLKAPLVDQKLGKIVCYPSKEKYPPDPYIVKFLKPYIEKCERLLDQVLGEAMGDFPKYVISETFRSSPLGNLITDAIKEFTKADIALQNTGGIRDNILKGKITLRTVRKVLPFANTVYTYKLTGKQILDILQVMAERDPENGGIFEVSGISFKVKNKKLIDVKVNNKPISLSKFYILAVNSFIARGGDGYSIFKRFPKYEDTGYYLSTILANYVKKHKKIYPSMEKRVEWIK